MSTRWVSALRVAAILTIGSLPAFAGVVPAVPEPSLVILMAVGIGAIVIVARKKRGR